MGFRRSVNITLSGVGAVEVYEMNGRAFVEWQESQQAGKSPVAVAAAVIVHCVPSFEDKSVDELLDLLTPTQLSDMFVAIIELSELDESKNSEAEARPVSSVS